MKNKEDKHIVENDDLKFIPMDACPNFLDNNDTRYLVKNLSNSGLYGFANNFLFDFAKPYPKEIYDDEAFPSCKITEDEPIHIKILREFDLLIDDYEDTRGKKSSVEKIFKKIEEKEESIMKVLKLYNIPYPVASLIVKKIISLTLKYKKD